MSSQTIYFTNPRAIQTMQTQVGTNPPSFSSNFNQYVTNFLTGPNAGFISNATGPGTKGYGVLAGNLFTGEEKFATVGLARKDGGLYDADNSIMQFSSASKIIVGLGYAKMLEEGLIQGSDSVGTYIPQMSTGIYSYYTSVTPTNPLDPSTWTNTKATGSLSAYTINDMFSCRFALTTPVYLAAFGAYLYTENPYFYYTAASASTGSLFEAMHIYNMYTGCFANSNAWFGKDKWFMAYNGYGQYDTRLFVQNLISYVNQGIFVLSAGHDSLYGGVNTADIPLNGYKYTYDTSYGILGLALDNCCQTKLGMSFVQYIKNKIFTPLEITKLYFLGVDPTPANFAANKVDYSFSRFLSFNPTLNAVFPGGIATGAGTASFIISPFSSAGASPTYYNAGLASTVTKVWAKDYTDDGFYKLVEGLYANNTSDCIFGPDPLFGTMKELCKLFKLVIGKGKYTKTDGTTVQVIGPQAINFLTSPKISALNNMSVVFGQDNSLGFGLNAWDNSNTSWCGSFVRMNRDITTNGLYPFSTSTCMWQGVSGHIYVFDLETGYYMLWSHAEYLLDSSDIVLSWGYNGSTTTPIPAANAFATCLRP
jgi:CubicO group peptidase (beta-lactamase class C family)